LSLGPGQRPARGSFDWPDLIEVPVPQEEVLRETLSLLQDYALSCGAPDTRGMY